MVGFPPLRSFKDMSLCFLLIYVGNIHIRLKAGCTEITPQGCQMWACFPVLNSKGGLLTYKRQWDEIPPEELLAGLPPA